MEFSFYGHIDVDEKDLDEMVKKVEAGESFDSVFEDISAEWDDWYNSDYIYEDVEAEVNRRIDAKEA